MCDSRCPTCGIKTKPSTVGGHPSLCLRCTEVELGETYEQIRDRATSKIQAVAKKKWRVI